MQRVTLQIEGMSCGHCVRAVREVLESVEGVTAERVEVGSAVVDFDPAHTDAHRISGVIAGAGYAARVVGVHT